MELICAYLSPGEEGGLRRLFGDHRDEKSEGERRGEKEEEEEKAAN